MPSEERKKSGAYYTPEEVVHCLVRWAVRRPTDRLLDPSAGDGRFLALHRRSVGVEQDPNAAAISRATAPWALVHEGDFFSWAASTKERFECAAGNPPFIRYQRFNGAVRERALALCASLGAAFSGLSSSWAPFLVATASLLKPGGRMAFVVPAEIGHAPYAHPLLQYLIGHFSDVRLLAIKNKVFPNLSEDAWLLYADGFGGEAEAILFAARERFTFLSEPLSTGTRVSLGELVRWNFRMRPFLMAPSVRELYQDIATRSGVQRLGALAQVGIGYVTGANEFFHLRPSQAKATGIPAAVLQPTIRSGRALCGEAVTRRMLAEWLERDDPVLLLRLSPGSGLPKSVENYLNTRQAREASESYKCSNRSPWYVVPDVIIPDAFLSYMSGNGPALVANRAGCACTNSVHTVRITGNANVQALQQVWAHSFTRLSCELEGHPLGGGMLKIEPREAQKIVLAPVKRWSRDETRIIDEGLNTLRDWRHYSGEEATTAV